MTGVDSMLGGIGGAANSGGCLDDDVLSCIGNMGFSLGLLRNRNGHLLSLVVEDA